MQMLIVKQWIIAFLRKLLCQRLKCVVGFNPSKWCLIIWILQNCWAVRLISTYYANFYDYYYVQLSWINTDIANETAYRHRKWSVSHSICMADIRCSKWTAFLSTYCWDDNYRQISHIPCSHQPKTWTYIFYPRDALYSIPLITRDIQTQVLPIGRIEQCYQITGLLPKTACCW